MEFSRTVYFEAYACSEFGEGPEYARIVANQCFCDELSYLKKLCAAYNLSELRVYGGPDAWGPGNAVESLRMCCAEMVVTHRDFYFTDHPKYADYPVETRPQDIDHFLSVVTIGGEALFLGDDTESLRERVEESESPR